MKTKAKRISTMFLAVMLCMAALSISAFAVDVKTTTPSAVTTPNGTGTVVSNTTNSDGKEFLTVKTADDHVFYLIIDKQKTGDNVYFLDAVTEKDLLSLAQSDSENSDSSGALKSIKDAQSSETASTSDKSSTQTTSTPVSTDTSQIGQQSATGKIAAVVLLSVVIVGVIILIAKLRKPKAPAQTEKDVDDYDFLSDEDTESDHEAEVSEEDMEDDA